MVDIASERHNHVPRIASIEILIRIIAGNCEKQQTYCNAPHCPLNGSPPNSIYKGVLGTSESTRCVFRDRQKYPFAKTVAFVSFLMVSFFCLQSMPQWRLPAEDVYHALFCVYMLPS